MKRVVWALTMAILATGLMGGAQAEHRHTGYYYPKPASQEVYEARVAEPLPQASRTTRVAFVTAITNQQMKRPFPPTAALFAKGDEAQKLILVALEDGRLDTIYRVRAVFANMTAAARVLPAFRDMGGESTLTFFDLAKMLGFTQITATNGREFAHQVILE